MTNALELDGVCIAYGGVEAVRDVTLRVAAGSVVCLLGANGAGKSSLLNALVGLAPIQKGDARWRGRSLANRPAHEAVRAGIALSPEGRRLFPGLTVLENLRLGAYRSRSRAELTVNLAKVHALFPRLAERSGQQAGSLSGGEQQMCAIGRALMSAPELLLLDEPSLGLAPKVIAEVGRTITEVNRSGVTVLLVEQNAKMALRLSSYGYVIEAGRLVLHGTSASLAGNAHVQASYLGEAAGADAHVHGG